MNDLSVVILTYNKQNEIPLVLHSLKLQKNDVDNWELIIIDNGSIDNTVKIINEYKDELPIKLFINNENNRSKARNFGIDKSSGIRIVFLDGDMVPCRNFLKKHNSYGEKSLIVLGRRENLRNKMPEDQVKKLYNNNNVYILEIMMADRDEREPYFDVIPFDKQLHKWRFLFSHNFSIPLDIIKNVKGFDKEFINWGCEDLELGYRLYLNQIDFIYDRDCLAVHLYHDKSNNQMDYKKNLIKFYNKYSKPEIELLFIDWELNPFESNQAYNNSLLNSLTIEMVSTILLNKSNNIILNNISIINNKDSNFDKINGLGLYIDNIKKRYDLAVVSSYLVNIGMAVFVEILDNMLKIADNIYLFDPEKKIASSLKIINKHNPKRVFKRINQFWLYRKTNNTDKINIHLSIKRAQDSLYRNFKMILLKKYLKQYKDMNIALTKRIENISSSAHFLQFKKNNIELPNIILNDDKTFIFPQLWDFQEKKQYKNPIAIFWERIELFWEELFYLLEKEYDVLIFDNNEDCLKYKKIGKLNKPSYYIEPFVESNIFYPQKKQKTKQFKICFIIGKKNISDNYKKIIENISFEIVKNNNVVIEIYISKLENVKYSNPYINDQMNNKFESWMNAYNILNHYFILNFQFEDIKIKELIKKGNLKIIIKDLKPQEIAGIFRESNLFVSLNDPYLASLAVACNTEVIIGEQYSKYSLLNNHFVTFIKEKPVSGYLLDINLLPINQGYYYYNDYTILNVFDDKSVIQAIIDKYNNWLNNIIIGENDFHKKWLDEYSVENSCKKLYQILKIHK